MRRAAAILGVALSATLAPATGQAQNYPANPVKVIVPFAAGASTDGLARVIAHEFQSKLGGAFVVENRPGANGMSAAETVARATPDGYTLFVTTHSSQAANPSLYKNLPYDPVKDFTPIGRMTTGQFVLVVNPSLNVKTLPELIALAKAQPGKLSYATSNSTSLVAAEWLKALTGINIVGVPYRNNNQAITDLMANHVSIMFADQANSVPLVKQGKLTGLATTGRERSPLLPELPTVEEAGVKGFALTSWSGLYGPAGMPPALVEKLNGALNEALKKPEVIDRLSNGFGYELVTSTPAGLGEFNKAEVDLWRRAITAAKIEPQ